jgi:plastocyanin
LIDQIEGFLKFFPVNTFWKRGLSSVLLSLLAFVGQLSAADHFVDVLNNSFSPSSLQINVGDRVIWTNQDDDDDSHSATSNNGAWTGGLMVGFGDQFSVTFSSPGPFFYHDIFDGFSGSITVLAANTPPSVSITNPASGASFTAPATTAIVIRFEVRRSSASFSDLCKRHKVLTLRASGFMCSAPLAR